jgi:hypothetical protein
MIEAANISVMSAHFYQTTQRNIPEKGLTFSEDPHYVLLTIPG